MRAVIGLIILFLSNAVVGQYAPPAGQPGSAAVSADSSLIFQWADSVLVERGLMHISDSAGEPASHGNPQSALGHSDLQVVSLGDGGTATYVFDPPLSDTEGNDIAVFENSFSDEFLELAFVEISSDGEQFFRFPSVSLTPVDEQVGAFGTLDATLIHNLAGKYRGGYGVPFDFAELESEPGLDMTSVTHIRIVDVVGSINEEYARYDSQGNIINDPFPTAFETGGFDLDALAVLGPSVGIAPGPEASNVLKVYPNPFSHQVHIESATDMEYELFDLNGNFLEHGKWESGVNVPDWSYLQRGIYFIKFTTGIQVYQQKVIKK